MFNRTRKAAHLYAAAYAVLCLSISAQAQQTTCRVPLPDWLLPSDENYKAPPKELGQAAAKPSVYDRLHHIPLGGDDHPTTELAVGGEVRQWYEYFSAPPFSVGGGDSNGYLLQRYMVHVDAHFTDRVRFFTEFKGDLVTDREGGPRPDIDEDRGDLNQAFLEAKLISNAARSLTVRAGRQELVFGSGRFVDMREGPNVRRAFDGGKVTYCDAAWRVDAFAVKPVEHPPGAFDDKPTHGTSFWGVYSTRHFRQMPRGGLDLYYLGLDQKQSHYNQGNGREQRQTLGARASASPATWDYDFEAALQFGTFGSKDIRAWTLASATGKSFPHAVLQPRFGVKLDAASGDSNPGGNHLGTFNPLFPSLHYFGEEGSAGPLNFYDVRPEAKLHFRKNVSLYLDTDWFWRQSPQDGVYLPGPFLLVSSGTSTARYIGNQTAGEFAWDSRPHWIVTIYASRFTNGSFVHQASTATDFTYVAGWVTYHF